MKSLFPALLIFLIIEQVSSSRDSFSYCLPSNTSCWPNQAHWDILKSRISHKKLHYIGDSSQYDGKCKVAGNDPYRLENEGHGRCMQYHDCSKVKCNENAEWNLPVYSVEASTEEDVIEALRFANRHDLQVVVKTTGHSFAGSSTADGALLIWMRNFRKFGEITESFKKCGRTYRAAMKVGGGQVWGEVYREVEPHYHIVGGGGAFSVSAAGGWLMGGGLSTTSRLYGMGIDNVLEFEVILADGSKVVASACQNEDLFWGLRGGGGGSFGVVSSVQYKLHKRKDFCEVKFAIPNFPAASSMDLARRWMELIIDSAPSLPSRWGGYWFLGGAQLYYRGSQPQLEGEKFLGQMKSLGVQLELHCAGSYLKSRHGDDLTTAEDTGYDNLYIGSRVIPSDLVQNNPDKMKQIFATMLTTISNSSDIGNLRGTYVFSYLVGGKMTKVGRHSTAVHPANRRGPRSLLHPPI